MAGGAIPGRAPVRPAIAMTVRSGSVKWAVVIGAAALAVAGCGSSDSTASKTPEPTVTSPVPATARPSSPMPSITAPTTTEAADPCAVNLAAPEIIKAVSELPRDPRSNQAWNPEPLAGNYNECAQLSAVIVRANTNSENPNTRAVLFHLGKFIPTGVPDTYGFNGIDDSTTTGDTIALRYSGGIQGLDSVVKFRWNGNGVELIGNTPG
jgi:LppP/LprE lipoprotein